MLIFNIVGDAAVIAELEKKRTTLTAALFQTMKAEGQSLVAYIRTHKFINGPTKGKNNSKLLHHRTGRLQDSIKATSTQSSGSINTTIGTNVEYAAVHEYGFSGEVTVKEHLRMIKQAFGRAIKPVQATVREHARMVNIPERSFLRSSLKENEKAIVEALQDTVNKVLLS
jgi:phage gpG-like protein